VSEARKKLRRLLNAPGAIAAPGVFDAIGARVVEDAGFSVAYMGGYGVEATYGNPDLGLLSMVEVVGRAEAIASSVSIPVIADADDGYGNALNAARTLKAFERAGVAAIQLEDQEAPKKCGSLSDLRLLPVQTFVGKLKSVLDAREDQDLLIIARTDANRTAGLEAALERALAYEDAGADITFVQLPRTIEEIESIVATCRKPLMITVSESALVPIVPFNEYERLGLKFVVYPLMLLMATVSAMKRAANHLHSTGRYEAPMDGLITWEELDNGLLRMDRTRALGARYDATPTPERGG
jgi:2,3-dimethylmalate lyase